MTPENPNTAPRMPDRGTSPQPTNAALQAASAIPFDPHSGMHWLVHVGSPMVISLLIHGLLLLLFAGITAAVVQSRPGNENIEYRAMVVAAGSEAAGEGSFRFPGSAMTDQPDLSAKSPGVAGGGRLSDLLNDDRALDIPRVGGVSGLADALNANTLSRNDIIGTGSGGAVGAPGLGSGNGDRDIAGGGPVGSLWGVGEGQVARSVVYVVDRSGSFIDWTSAIDRELMKSIGILKADQNFNLIFLHDNESVPFKPQMSPADIQQKREAFAWINLHVPTGGSDLTPAVRLALNYKPEIMFIVADYELFSSEVKHTNLTEMVNAIREARRSRNLTVNVILMGPFDRPTIKAAELRRRIDAGGEGLTPGESARARIELDVLSAIEAIEKLPRETGGTLQYLNGERLMEAHRNSQQELERRRRESRSPSAPTP